MRRTVILMLFIFSTKCTLAQYLPNGSVTGFPVGTNLLSNASGWQACGGTPDLCNLNSPSFSSSSNAIVSTSPDGGSWVGLYGDTSISLLECASTSIEGLTCGRYYILRFYMACFGTGVSVGSEDPAEIALEIAADTHYYFVDQEDSIWTSYTISFIARSSVEELRIKNLGGDSYASLDGFMIEPQFSIGNDTVLCESDSIILYADTNLGSFQWNNGSTDSNLIVNESGVYWLEITADTCSYRDSITITYDSVPTMKLGEDTTICKGDTLFLSIWDSSI